MKIMNITLQFAMLVLCSHGFLQAQPVTEHGRLSVKGTRILDEHGNEVMLKGVSFGWHNWWPRFYNRDCVAWLAGDWQCSVVRAAMGVEPERGYLSQPEWSVGLIEAVVDAAIENDIYVIIDWHSHGIQTEAAKKFFSAMAEKYGKYPNIIYEIFNEPVRDSWEDVKTYSVEVIKAIRRFDPDNIILVGNPHWDQDLDLVAEKPIRGYDNLMYTLHFYAAGHPGSLREKADRAIRQGIPVFVSESGGMSPNGDGPLDYVKWQEWIDWMYKNKISWVTWSISDKNESCSMLRRSAGSAGNWPEADLTESGIKTRGLLRSTGPADY
jgi:endoglucanase